MISAGKGLRMELTAIHPPDLDPLGFAGMRTLARAWRDLEDRATLPTQDAAFLGALCATFLARDELALFQVGGERGFDAVLPLCRSPGRFTRWRLMGDEELCEPGDALCRDSVAARRLAELVARQPRPLVMQRVPAGSAFVPALREAMEGRGLVRVRLAAACPTLALDAGWSEPEAKFSSRRRSDFRRAARRAAGLGEVSYETLAPSAHEFDVLFDEAIRVEAASWKAAAGTTIAGDPAKQAFFRAYFRAACETGACRMSFLRIGGRAAAMQLAVDWGGRRWLFKIGHDDAFGRCSPGTLLMLHAIGEAARAGCTGLELMGKSEGWIADLWTRDEHPCLQVRTYPFGAAGAFALLVDSAAWVRARLARSER